MKYLISNDKWNLEAYHSSLRALRSRIPRSVLRFLTMSSFHDSDTVSITVKNLNLGWGSCPENPTQVSIYLEHPSDQNFSITYSGVVLVRFEFDGRENKFPTEDGDMAHIEDWGIHMWDTDELTEYDDTYLSHEISFVSSARLHLLFRTIALRKRPNKRTIRRV